MSGSILVVSGPSGSGKTSLAKKLLDIVANCYFSISTTTRKPRDGEEDGVDYHFISKDQFLSEIDDGCFLEWAEVHGNFYGTSFRPIEKALAENKIVVLDIDVQGHKTLREKFPKLVTSVFITTKNMSVLKQRLSSRNTETKEILEQRVINAISEMRSIGEYDYFLINDDFNETLEALTAIATASKFKQSLIDNDSFIKSWKI
ncbi:MAG: guanylate kinase [Campylobacteraceae bacterium]|jgi:guanylate kinase|nr:guanylate kinase [Campylobacteraceae bacterium]